MESKRFLYIAIATFITVIVWVSLDILHSRSEVQVSQEVQSLLEPINPEFDQEVLNGI